MNTKKLAFIVMMGALGNVLFAISYFAGPIAPGVALDFSLIPVLIAGFFVGPVEGLTIGVIAGILPGIMFGPAGTGGWLGLIGLPVGKALTGVMAGLLSRSVNLQKHHSLLGIPLTLVAYVPEAIFTYAYFAFLLPFFLPTAFQLPTAIIITILIKAFGEMIIMGFVIAALLGNKGFCDFIKTYSNRECVNQKKDNNSQ